MLYQNHDFVIFEQILSHFGQKSNICQQQLHLTDFPTFEYRVVTKKNVQLICCSLSIYLNLVTRDSPANVCLLKPSMLDVWQIDSFL